MWVMLFAPWVTRAQEQEAKVPEQPATEMSATPSGRFDAPTWVMFRSLAFPGWGQAKNGTWLKALIVAGIEVAFIERLVYENRMVHEYRDKAAACPPESDEKADYYRQKQERHESHRRDFIWWTSLFVLLSMGDAYVDAHLRAFDVRLQAEPEVGEGDGDGESAALSLRISLALRF